MSETTASGVPAGEVRTELKRAIGPTLLLFFVIGDILGTGIYALTGSVAGEIGGAFGDTYLREFVQLPTWAVATVLLRPRQARHLTRT